MATPAVPGMGTTPAVPAGLPGIPSPAQGVPSTPDFLTGLVQAGPEFTQGYQQGEQIREQRRQRAMQDLQILSQQAASNPTDPSILRTLQKTARTLGYDPKVFLAEDGKSVNTGALAQYNPYFQTAMQVIANPNADPQTQEYFAKLIGLHDFKASGVSMKQYATDVKNFWDQYDKFSAGTGDVNAIKAAGNQAYQEAMQRGDTVTANSVQQALANPQLGAKTQAQIGHLDQDTKRIMAMGNLDAKRAQLVATQTQYVMSQLALQGLKGDQMKTHIQEMLVHMTVMQQNAATAATNAQAHMMQAQAALTNAGTNQLRAGMTGASNAMKSAESVNTDLRQLRTLKQNLTNTVQHYLQTVGGSNAAAQKIPAFTQAAAQLKQVNDQLYTMTQWIKRTGAAAPDGTFDTTKVYGRMLQGQGLPSTATVKNVTPVSNTSQMMDLKGQSYSRKQLLDFARKHGKSLQQAIKEVESRGGTVTP